MALLRNGLHDFHEPLDFLILLHVLCHCGNQLVVDVYGEAPQKYSHVFLGIELSLGVDLHLPLRYLELIIETDFHFDC